MRADVKNRISILFSVLRITFHWGFIPTILYLGFQKGADSGMPGFTPLSLLWQ